MTNQTLNQSVIGLPDLTGNRVSRMKAIIALGILLVAIAAVGLLSLTTTREAANAPASNLSPLPTDGRAYFTEPYWQAAAARAATSVNLSPLPQDGRAYFTEPYWQAAEARAATSVNLSPLPQDGRTYFTEPYWEAMKTAAQEPAPAEPEWAYYTERYWNLSQEQD